jgi:two-component system sensor histidine kinase TctE
MVRGDRASIYELAANLIDNAVRYTPAGGAVTVRIETINEAGGDSADLIVEDNGPGIPEDERERVFERFYRLLDRNTVSGSGLGLAIVREIATSHKASVSVGEGNHGRGTRITIKFVAAGLTVVNPRTDAGTPALVTSE